MSFRESLFRYILLDWNILSERRFDSMKTNFSFWKKTINFPIATDVNLFEHTREMASII